MPLSRTSRRHPRPPRERDALAAETAREVFSRFDQTRRCLVKPRDAETAETYFARLAEEGAFSEGVTFAAHWLPLRHAIWWGCLCVWNQQGAQASQATLDALETAVCWTLQPTEAARQAARSAADLVGAAAPVGALAHAVVLSGGSIAPPACPPVPPPPGLAQRCVANAVILASSRSAPALTNQAFRHALRMAWEVRNLTSPWQESALQPNHS